MKKLIFIVPLFFILACNPSEETTIKEEKIIQDSIYENQIKVIEESQNDMLDELIEDLEQNDSIKG